MDARRLWHIDAVQVAGGVHPIKFRSYLGGAPSDERGTIDIFAMNAPAMASPGFYEPLGRYLPGVAATRRLPTQKAVKRKSQATHRIKEQGRLILIPRVNPLRVVNPFVDVCHE